LYSYQKFTTDATQNFVYITLTVWGSELAGGNFLIIAGGNFLIAFSTTNTYTWSRLDDKNEYHTYFFVYCVPASVQYFTRGRTSLKPTVSCSNSNCAISTAAFSTSGSSYSSSMSVLHAFASVSLSDLNKFG